MTKSIRQRKKPSPIAVGGTSIRHEECVRVASVEIEEFPARFCADLGTTWSDWLDSMDGDLARVGEFADELVESGDDGVLLNASLFYIRQVDVHPAFTGQQIGARLVAHSLWSLSRSEFDVAMLIAKAVTGQFREGEPDCSEAAIRRLVHYYQRMGFERSRPDERIDDADAVLMHVLVGIYQLPFRHLGGMGIAT